VRVVEVSTNGKKNMTVPLVSDPFNYSDLAGPDVKKGKYVKKFIQPNQSIPEACMP